MARNLLLMLLLVAANGCAHDVDYLLNATYDIADISISGQYIEILGDVSLDFYEGETVEITQSSVYNRKVIAVTITVVDGNTRLAFEDDLTADLYDILAVDRDAQYFELEGDHVTDFNNVLTLEIKQSTGNDARYTLDETILEGENTRLIVLEEIPSATADGTIQAADYGILKHGEADTLIPEPTSVRMRFVTEQNFSPSFWYYMVFNFTKAPATYNTTVPAEERPIDEISGADRARNWELYTVVHVDGGGGEEAYALQRPRLPTVLDTASGPLDVVAGYFDDGLAYLEGELIPAEDAIIDLAVACSLDNKVQLISGIVPSLDPSKVTYYSTPSDIAASIADDLISPMRVYADELTGDQNTDLLVLYQGDDTANPPIPAVLRVLTGDGDGNFTAEIANTELSGKPLDWAVGHFNEDTLVDVAVVTTSDTANQVELYMRTDISGEEEDPVYSFTAGEIHPVGDDPVGLAAGALEGSVLDIVVADSGGTIDSDEDNLSDKLRTFINDGLGVFTPGPVLALEGVITGVSTGILKGNQDDIVASYFPYTDGARDTDEQGNLLGSVAVFFSEGETDDIEDTVPTVTFVGDPHDLIVFNTNGTQGSYPSVIAVDGRPNTGPGDDNQTMFILRTGRDGADFIWETELVTYLTGGHEPSRINLVDFNRDGAATDFVIADSADSEGGNRISLFYSLGKQKAAGATGTFYHETRHNYSSADIYWTDEPPESLSAQEWYLDHTIGPNYFELVIDPLLFYDLARLPPETLMVEFMTGTTAVEYERNQDGLGLIRDVLIEPVVIEIEVNHNEYQQISPKIGVDIDDAPANIIDYIVEVL